MSDEPIYQFVRGQGWVATTALVFVGFTSRYRVTLTKRKPVDGERFWSDCQATNYEDMKKFWDIINRNL